MPTVEMPVTPKVEAVIIPVAAFKSAIVAIPVILIFLPLISSYEISPVTPRAPVISKSQRQ